MTDNVVFITREPSKDPVRDGASNPSTLDAKDMSDGDTRLFREYIKSNQKIQLLSAGIINDSLSAVSGLNAEVGTSGNVIHQTHQKREDGDPITEIEGAKDLEFRADNQSGNSQTGVSARWVYRVVTYTPTQDGWPQLGYDRRNIGVRSDGGVSSAPSVDWSFSTSASNVYGAALWGGTAYVSASNDAVYALDASDGSELWSATEVGGGTFSHMPVYHDGTVYLGTTESKVWAINADDGSIKWEQGVSDWVDGEAVKVHDGRVFVSVENTYGNSFYALDTSDGSELWSVSNGGAYASGCVGDNGSAYVATYQPALYSYDVTDGTEEWSYTTDTYSYNAPTYHDGTVYVGDANPTIHSVNASDGSQNWSVASPGSGIPQESACLYDGKIIFTDGDGYIFALNTSDGSTAWSTSLSNGFEKGPAIANGTIFAATGSSNCYAFDPADGSQLWNVTIPNNVMSALVPDESGLYVGDDNGEVHKLS